MASFQSSQSPSLIHLDYGCDSATLLHKDISIFQNGLCFPARWQLQTGTEISVCVQRKCDGLGCRSFVAKGLVVDSQPDHDDPSVYRITIWFLETSEDIPDIINALSFPPKVLASPQPTSRVALESSRQRKSPVRAGRVSPSASSYFEGY